MKLAKHKPVHVIRTAGMYSFDEKDIERVSDDLEEYPLPYSLSFLDSLFESVQEHLESHEDIEEIPNFEKEAVNVLRTMHNTRFYLYVKYLEEIGLKLVKPKGMEQNL